MEWEPRIDVVEVLVDVADRRRGRLDVTIGYRIRTTNTFYNLVHPFYVQEGRTPATPASGPATAR